MGLLAVFPHTTFDQFVAIRSLSTALLGNRRERRFLFRDNCVHRPNHCSNQLQIDSKDDPDNVTLTYPFASVRVFLRSWGVLHTLSGCHLRAQICYKLRFADSVRRNIFRSYALRATSKVDLKFGRYFFVVCILRGGCFQQQSSFLFARVPFQEKVEKSFRTRSTRFSRWASFSNCSIPILNRSAFFTADQSCTNLIVFATSLSMAFLLRTAFFKKFFIGVFSHKELDLNPQ